jgi:hypothetical protein
MYPLMLRSLLVYVSAYLTLPCDVVHYWYYEYSRSSNWIRDFDYILQGGTKGTNRCSLHWRPSWASSFHLELRNQTCNAIAPLCRSPLHSGRASSVRLRDRVHIKSPVTRLFILPLVMWEDTGFGWVIRFTGLLETITAINYSRFTTSRTNSSLVFTRRCLETATNIIHSSDSVITFLLIDDWQRLSPLYSVRTNVLQLPLFLPGLQWDSSRHSTVTQPPAYSAGRSVGKDYPLLRYSSCVFLHFH